MGTFVTLTEVLEARGSPLEEDEVWCLLLATADALLDISKKPGNMCTVLSPGSVLLSANGSLAFKSCAQSEDVASYTAPEVQQGLTPSTRAAAEKVVYSLGMTLYWCADYHLPQNQPVQISTELEGLLLSMCEDMAVRRTDLLTVLETCEFHHKSSMLPSPERLIRQLEIGPEFLRVLEEPLVILELPGSILTKKGKSPATHRELSVVMPNGQSILVKCEVKTRGGDVFDMIVAHSNLVEHFYFGLAYIDNEFFFVDNDTKISKVAPDSWKKVPTTTFVLFFRIKFFVNNISLLHKQTRHQYYLQLRRDLLEDRLSCHEATALYLGGLALQTEYGDCMPKVYGRNYYRPDQYISKSVMEKRALPYIQAELLRLHANNAQMLTDESELEFLKQLPEYGVFFHRVIREKRPLDGEIVLGVCAKGVIVYEVKDGCRSTAQNFFWRETSTISSSQKRKFIIECRGSRKKYIFITEKSRIAKYLCNLCSAQHKFNNEMSSRQLSHSLVSDNIVQYAAVCRAQSSQLKSISCSETPQDDSGLTTPQEESLTKLCDDVTARIEARMETPPKLGTPSEREVVCISLKKDPKLGLIVIVGEDAIGRYDLGIFIASIVPGGPADKDGRIRPGRLISLNHVSLEGVTFSEAAEVMEGSPEEVELIVSQPKGSQTTLMTDGRSGDDSLDEIVSVMMTPKASNRLHVPRD
uniref:FERM and PDZ domain containing 2 n=1 Tax=Poecilia latipinna TaxID=48699 RepID=A0A3B3UGY0_9TELE